MARRSRRHFVWPAQYRAQNGAGINEGQWYVRYKIGAVGRGLEVGNLNSEQGRASRTARGRIVQPPASSIQLLALGRIAGEPGRRKVKPAAESPDFDTPAMDRPPNPENKKSKAGPKNPTLPTNRERSGTHGKPSQKASAPAEQRLRHPGTSHANRYRLGTLRKGRRMQLHTIARPLP